MDRRSLAWREMEQVVWSLTRLTRLALAMVYRKVSAGFIESSSDDDDDGDGDGEEEGGNKGDYEKRRAGKPSDKSHPAALSDSGTEESVDSTSSAPKAAKSAPKVHRKR